MFKNIRRFKCAADVIGEFLPGVIEDLTDEERTAVRHVDDFESLEYFVIDEKKVIVTDSLTGDVIQEFKSIVKFLIKTLTYIEEENQNG